MAISQCSMNCHVQTAKAKISLQEFETSYLKGNEPVVIENSLSKLPCSKWTMEYLLTCVGNNPVIVRGKTNLQHYKVGYQIFL